MSNKKEVKKKKSIFLIINLILSVIAFSFILNINFVSADGFDDYLESLYDKGWKKVDGGYLNPSKTYKATEEELRKEYEDTLEPPPPGTNTNKNSETPTPAHGYAGQAINWLFPGSTAPKGKVWDEAAKKWRDALPSETGASGLGYSASGILQSAAHALEIYYGIKMLGEFLGEDDDKKLDSYAKAASIGFFAGRSAYKLLGEDGWLKIGEGLKGWQAGAIGIGMLIWVYYKTYEEISTKNITFSCESWQAPTGGEYCEECNKQGILPCSEYQCISLGQSCQLLNKGTGEEKCAWVNRDDVEVPIITPWKEVLTVGYDYKPDNTISPPDRGVKIVNTETSDGCLKAFSPLSFGITVNEPAQCRIDYIRKDSFDNMNYNFGGTSLFKYNHSEIMNFPGKENAEAENLTLRNNGEFGMYVRCQDKNGNKNIGNFVFKFCIEEGPDTTPPLIITTNVLDGMPIAYNQSTLENFIVYVNEPAQCRWSKTDQDYENMENDFSCSSSIREMNAQMVYECKTTLTGLKDKQENKFYFRCKDKPKSPEQDRNVNSESYPFTLIGTRPLYINSIKPNGTIKDSTEIVEIKLEVETSAGYKEGDSTCYYSESCYKEGGSSEEGSYTAFYYENESSSHSHSQKLNLGEGTYECFVKCVDLGGNSDTKKTEFKVETDENAPIVVRIYQEENYLKLITNEESECVYDTSGCDYLFEDGISFSTLDNFAHFTEWNLDVNYYIKCQDAYGNCPMPNECSIIAKPFEIKYE
jgi:hypothetical protein